MTKHGGYSAQSSREGMLGNSETLFSASLLRESINQKVLLHCCCAPCACSIIERILHAKIDFAIFFYNPNIHPEEEYQRRKGEIVAYANKQRVPVIDADYDPSVWLEHVKGYEHEPERGKRCSLCFEFRLRKTAEYASKHGFSGISTTLGISRWKNFEQVTEAGRRAISSFPSLSYLDVNWRKDGGVVRMEELIKQEQFYRQNYCGCVYSIRKNN